MSPAAIHPVPPPSGQGKGGINFYYYSRPWICFFPARNPHQLHPTVNKCPQHQFWWCLHVFTYPRPTKFTPYMPPLLASPPPHISPLVFSLFADTRDMAVACRCACRCRCRFVCHHCHAFMMWRSGFLHDMAGQVDTRWQGWPQHFPWMRKKTQHNCCVTSPLPSLRDVGTIYTPAIPPPPTTRRAEMVGITLPSPQSKCVNVGAHKCCCPNQQCPWTLAPLPTAPTNDSTTTNSTHEHRRHYPPATATPLP